MKERLWTKIIRYICVICLAFVIFFPFYWILISSFKTERELLSANCTFLPFTFTLQHYQKILTQSTYPINMLNSGIVAFASTGIGVILAILSAFSMSDFKYPLKKIAERSILYTSMFPGVLLMIPIYVLMAKIGLLNNLWSLILVYVTLYAPFSIFTLRTFFEAIPKTLREAAYIDGATKMQVLSKVILPLATPGLVTVASWTFILSWSEYLFGMILINDPLKKTLVVGLSDWMGEYYLDWGALTAGSVLVILPVILFFSFMGKGFIKGLTAGGVKG
jgi:multiple sugar transport system permease protein